MWNSWIADENQLLQCSGCCNVETLRLPCGACGDEPTITSLESVHRPDVGPDVELSGFVRLLADGAGLVCEKDL